MSRQGVGLWLCELKWPALTRISVQEKSPPMVSQANDTIRSAVCTCSVTGAFLFADNTFKWACESTDLEPVSTVPYGPPDTTNPSLVPLMENPLPSCETTHPPCEPRQVVDDASQPPDGELPMFKLWFPYLGNWFVFKSFLFTLYPVWRTWRRNFDIGINVYICNFCNSHI